MSGYKFHPYAEIFPLFADVEFDALVEDIKAHGLREGIWLYQGKILDGRNRFLACKAAKVEPQFREYKGDDALAFVLSLNLQRRHLDESQRSMVAGKVANLKPGRPAEKGSIDPVSIKGSIDPVSINAAAGMMNVGTASVKRAKKVIEKGSKALQKAVDSGEVSVSKAAKVVDLPKPEQLSAAKAPAKKTEPEPSVVDERWVPDEDEDEKLALVEKEYTASIDKVMAADDKLAAAHAEIKRQAAEIAVLTLARNGYQNQCAELIRRVKILQRENAKFRRRAA